MRITIDNIEESIEKITLEVDFKNGTTHKEVYYESKPRVKDFKETKKVENPEVTEVPDVPEVPDITGREEKEIPEEMLNLEF